MTRRVALVVHGRFHAFDLARELLARGQHVTVFTNYPGWAADRFGLPRSAVRSFVRHALLSRSIGALGSMGASTGAERPLHRLFGRWVATELSRERWDVIHCWSGVSEELLRRRWAGRGMTVLMRGSAHIETQSRLLAEEAERAGTPIDAPSAWMREREAAEYGLADHVLVLSTFARQTFLDHGFAAERLAVLPLGAEVAAFRPPPDVVDRRCARILSGQPLRVLFTGAVSFRKGWHDLVATAASLRDEPFTFTCVGPVTPEVRSRADGCPPNLELAGKRAQHDLPGAYASADLFLFPTIEDGFGMVLAQARAGGLPVLTTTNSAGPDLVRDGVDGWVVPIRRPDEIVRRLRGWNADRAVTAAMARAAYDGPPPRDWRDVAEEFEALCEERLAGKEEARP